MIEVGSRVRNKGRGEWTYGTVVAKVPAGSTARWEAQKLGLKYRQLDETPARMDVSWLVKIVNKSGRERLRWPPVTSIEEA